MANVDAALLELAVACRVPQEFHFVLDGYDVPLFGCLAASHSEVDASIEVLLEGAALPAESTEKLRLMSSFRLLFQKCQSVTATGSNAGSAAHASMTSNAASWVDSFPAKLTGEEVVKLRLEFEASYPGEVLDADNTPGHRLLALAAKLVKPGEMRWVAWKHRMSKSQAKIPRLEELVYDEIPSRELPQGQVGMTFLQGILGLLCISLAFVKGAHLQSLRLYERKFIRLACQRHEASSGLRSPNMEELQAADKHIWGLIADLVNVHKWSLNDALTEVVQVRGDLAAMLQPRSQILKINRQPFKGNGKGKDSPGGKNGKGNKGNGTNSQRWMLSYTDSKGQRKQLSQSVAEHSDVRTGRSSELPSPTSADFSWEACLAILQNHCLGDAPLYRDTVLAGARSRAQYFNFGARAGSNAGLCKGTAENAEFVEYLNIFLRQIFPDGTWSSFCVSHNEFAHIHVDKNLPGSLNYSFSVGAFEKGGLWVALPADELPHLPRVSPPDTSADASLLGCIVQTRRCGFSWDGRIAHCSEPLVGDRWVVTAYTSCTWGSMTDPDLRSLRDLMFPLPGDAMVIDEAECESRAAKIDQAQLGLPVAIMPPDLDAIRGNLFLEICSGPNRPLSAALLAKGVSVLSIDILLHEDHNLLNDSTYDSLMRLCYSGQVNLAHASPPCTEYSRLKLRADGGPRALRTPEHMSGVPDLSPSERQRLEQSKKVLVRTINLLLATYCAGGHVSLENPLNSMAWLEQEVREFLQHINADLNCVAACGYGMDVLKQWCFACSFRDLQQIACCCQHDPQSHAQVAGIVDKDGVYASRATSEFPAQLAQAYAEAVLPLFETSSKPYTISLEQVRFLRTHKTKEELPRSTQDGGGIYSMPDWSFPPSGCKDLLGGVRKQLVEYLFHIRAPLRLRAHVESESELPLFTETEVRQFREIWQQWFMQQGVQSIDWSVAEHQPYSLLALQSLSRALQDRDDELFPALIAGVPTGFFSDIPPSHVFIPKHKGDSSEAPAELVICDRNWKGARENPKILSELIDKEISEGFLEELDLASAQQRWENIAVAKLNVVLADNRKPRSIMDGTVSGVNSSCFLNERYCLPSLKDVRSAFPLRMNNEDLSAFSLDIRAAHKTIRIREKDRGLAGIKLEDGRHLWYRVCPFGTGFSALWWARLSAFMIRTFHLLIWLCHALGIFVDDLLLWQGDKAIEISGCLILSFCQAYNVPLSWHKLQCGYRVKWIGWLFNFRSGTFSLPTDKIEKILRSVRVVLRPGNVDRCDLEKTVGLLQWVSQISPELRPWMAFLYSDLHRPVATNHHVDSGEWHLLHEYLDDNLRFTSQPPGTAIPRGARLLSARHIELHSKQDLNKVPLTSRRIYMRISDPKHPKRKLSECSRKFMEFWESWCMRSPLEQCLHLPPRSIACTLAADACAQGSSIGIGGFLRVEGSPVLWFSERFEKSDFDDLNIPLDNNTQKNIGCWELLAQIALALLFAETCPGGRCRLQLRTFCDNASAQASANRLMTTSSPLCFFAQQLAFVAFRHGITLDVHHISGFRNEEADYLSRWNGTDPLLPEFAETFRYRYPVKRMWQSDHDVRVFPKGTRLLWSPP
ncbi:unnamed protein product [Symbiodinium sp. CCMP2592]|nr:unnamed protein product [Symbiodinium sp. CCMP2592]